MTRELEQAVRSSERVMDRLLHAVTEYDRKQENKRGYNRYALPQYITAVNAVGDLIMGGKTMRQAIVACFSDRLLDACLRSVGEPIATEQELR